MPFKIVQTEERGTHYLEIVLDHWENDGISFWPKTGLSRRHKDDSVSNRPDDSFLEVPCKLKRGNIESFEKAKNILEVMQQNDDTDNNDCDTSVTKSVQMKKGTNITTKLLQVPDMQQLIQNTPQMVSFDSFIQTCLHQCNIGVIFF